MTHDLVHNMPSSIKDLPEAVELWTRLADMVANDDTRVVHLPKDDTTDLTLLTTLGAADEPVVTPEGGRDVTLKVEEARASDNQAQVTAKGAAVAETKFAANTPVEPERRDD